MLIKRVPIFLSGMTLACLCQPCYATPTMPQVFIPAGSYLRGLDEPPSAQYEIRLKSFQIDIDEVTNDQYQTCVQMKVCSESMFPGEADWPVVGVSWYDAQKYCKWLGKRLPTEAEWERVAFPKNASPAGIAQYFGDDICRKLWIGGYNKHSCHLPGREPIETSLRKSMEHIQLGFRMTPKDRMPVDGNAGDAVFDLFGNVAEWVSDWEAEWTKYGLFYYSRPIVTENPIGPPKGKKKVIRGGSFASLMGIFQGERRSGKPSARFRDVGFRCASD